MKKVRVAFYKAKEGGLDDKFINRFSGNLGYSHCELVLNSKRDVSAHMQTGGVAIFYYPNLLASKYWDVYELDLPMSGGVIKAVMKSLGTKYDFLGVALKFIGITIPNDEKVWCSEYLLMMINEAIDNYNKKNKLHYDNGAIVKITDTRIMPNDAYLLLKRKFNMRLISDSNSLEATYTSTKVDRWGRVRDKAPKVNWFWRLFN